MERRRGLGGPAGGGGSFGESRHLYPPSVEIRAREGSARGRSHRGTEPAQRARSVRGEGKPHKYTAAELELKENLNGWKGRVGEACFNPGVLGWGSTT